VHPLGYLPLRGREGVTLKISGKFLLKIQINKKYFPEQLQKNFQTSKGQNDAA
jgi:hypothetical protein